MRIAGSCVLLLAFLGGLPSSGAAQEATRPDAVRRPIAAADRRTGAERPSGGPAATPPALPAVNREAIEQRWGIRIEGIWLTAGGYMLDFRYRIADASKAAPLFDRGARAVLTDERTGAVMAVPVPPKTGPLRSTNDPKEGRTYFMFFANPGRFIAKYSRVTVAIGDFRVSGLTVGS